MVPLNAEFGWSTTVMSLAMSVNLLLYGLTTPFAAALLDRFGLRRVVASALALVTLGAGGSIMMGRRPDRTARERRGRRPAGSRLTVLQA